MSKGFALVALLACNGAAQAVIVDFDSNTLAASTGSTTALTTTLGLHRLNVTTADGYLSTIAAGQFTGVWIAREIAADGTYVVDFNGEAVNYVEFTINAISGNGPLPWEQFQQFTTIGGPGDLASYTINDPLSAYGTSSLSTLVIAADKGIDRGQFTVAISSPTSFTGFAFRHTQNPDQSGSVLIDVTANIIPAPASLAFMGLGVAAVGRRRR